MATSTHTTRRDSFEAERYTRFFHHLPSHAGPILDIGCNTGRGGAVLRNLCNDIVIHGLDLSAERVGVAEAATYNAVMCASATQIPATENCYAAITQGEFIEHVDFDHVLPVLRECHRVLRPGGVLLMTTPNPDSVTMKLRHRSVLGGEHVSQHYHRSLGDLLRSAGFERVSCQGSGKMTRYLGTRLPFIWVYGSYMLTAHKPELPIADRL